VSDMLAAVRLHVALKLDDDGARPLLTENCATGAPLHAAFLHRQIVTSGPSV